jgi:VWFA-related protein
MTPLRRGVVTVALAALAGLSTRAQQAPTLRATTYGVRIDALVSDAAGRPLTGLHADDFDVLDQGIPQYLDAAEAAGHVAVALAIDTSLSMRDVSMTTVTGTPGLDAHHRGFFPAIVHACDTLLRALRPGDRAALIAVTDRVVPLVPLTQDAGALRRGLVRVQVVPPRAVPLFTDGRGTITFEHETDGLMPQSNVWDATLAAAALVARDRGRPLVVLASDGIDDASWLSRAQVARALTNLGIAVDFVQTPSRRWHTGIAVPEALPKATGGTWYKTDDSKLAAKFSERLEYLRQSYVLTYEPRGVGTNDGWHDVVVKVKGRNATVKARPGYYANRPAK